MALRPWRTIELCAGVGGLGLGVHIAEPGSRCIAYVEREAYAAAVLAARMEAGDLAPAAVWSDIATFDARRMRGAVDCVISGDPCQPNSVAGKRGGADDERFLIDQVVRIFDESGACRLFRENVTGNADGQLAAIVPALERLGCRVAAGIFSAAETGASHRRERLFIMADRSSDGHWRHYIFGEDPHPPREAQAPADQRERLWGVAGGEGAGMGDSAGPRSHASPFPRTDRRDESRGSRDAESERRGDPMDDAERAERGQISGPRTDHGPHCDAQWQEGSDRAGTSGARDFKQLGEPNCENPQGRRADADQIGRQEPLGSVGLSGGTVGHAPCERRGEGRAEPILWGGRHAIACDGIPLFAPGPADPRWPSIIEAAPHLEPAVCRVADGMANRVDELRACGNGVVPLAAAVAWVSLDALLAEARSARPFAVSAAA